MARRQAHRYELIALALADACGFDPSGSSSAWKDGGLTDARGSVDAGDGSTTGSGSHLLLSEVKTLPIHLSFFEIYNPGCDEVDLSMYYITDESS